MDLEAKLNDAERRLERHQIDFRPPLLVSEMIAQPLYRYCD